MNWTKEDFQKLNIKTGWIYEIQELIEIIKDMNGEDISQQKKLSTSKQ